MLFSLRWVFRTISDTVETAKELSFSPRRALDDKFFSSTYWHWQHRYLIDTVKQFGYPTLFITISSYEWDFPMVINFCLFQDIRQRHKLLSYFNFSRMQVILIIGLFLFVFPYYYIYVIIILPKIRTYNNIYDLDYVDRAAVN